MQHTHTHIHTEKFHFFIHILYRICVTVMTNAISSYGTNCVLFVHLVDGIGCAIGIESKRILIEKSMESLAMFNEQNI